jgi:hypothetical protein
VVEREIFFADVLLEETGDEEAESIRKDPPVERDRKNETARHSASVVAVKHAKKEPA